MTRRAALLGMISPTLGMTRLPDVGATPDRTSVDSGSDGFVVSGELQAENEPGYYTLNGAEAVSLMLSPELTPSMVRAADALVKQQVELVLRKKL